MRHGRADQSAVIHINLRTSSSTSVGARVVDEGLGGPLWSPMGGDGILFLQGGSQGNRTRATMKALPATPHRPRPYGIGWACSEGEAYSGRSIGCGRDKSAPTVGRVSLVIGRVSLVIGRIGSVQTYQRYFGAKRRMTTLASCSRHARISHALQGYWPAHYRESSMPQRCSSTCWDTGFERRPRRGCRRWIRDYMRRDSGPIRILLLAKLRPRRVQISD